MEIHESFMDAWLLSVFPGRTLEELDQMDWSRFSRAREALRIENAEKMRSLHFGGKKKASDLTDDEWHEIRENDRLLMQYGTP